MRQLTPKEKDHVLVEVPDHLRDGMREVFEMLQDPDSSVDYDDAIQVEGLCGGKYRRGKRPFGFTYYPQNAVRNATWSLTLHPLEIEDIADGVMTHIKLYSCKSPDCGNKFREADEHCFYCDYSDDGIPEPPRVTRRSVEKLAKEAEADARMTDSRCPHCGKPCPSYRKTCKHCRERVNG